MLISLLLSLDRRAVAAGIVGLRMDRRTPVLPRPRLFELRRHLNEQILPTEGCYELRPDRQPRRVPVQWQRNRRLARHIVRGRELYQRQQALPSPGWVVRGCDQSDERRRGLSDRWGQQEAQAVCPNDSNSCATSATAALQSACSGAPPAGDCFMMPMRSRPRLAATSCANGLRWGGAA